MRTRLSPSGLNLLHLLYWQMSKSLVFTKEEAQGPWNMSTVVDPRALQRQLEEDTKRTQQRTLAKSQAMVGTSRPSLVGRYEQRLEGLREDRRRQEEELALSTELFGEGGRDTQKYPEGWRAHMKARGTKADRQAVLELDNWEPPATEDDDLGPLPGAASSEARSGAASPQRRGSALMASAAQ